MPMTNDFQNRLSPIVEGIAKHYGTPFHIYDEKGMRETGQTMIEKFSGIEGFREYFAVKANPNPRVMEIMASMGFGFDCSSVAELLLSRGLGAEGESIMFTSNNTSKDDFSAAAADGGCVL
ncbi:MAG: diaminopimelate decarboxylase, partial [Candidatus Sedimenticola sp. (ex Thyasira tokunagai)]